MLTHAQPVLVLKFQSLLYWISHCGFGLDDSAMREAEVSILVVLD